MPSVTNRPSTPRPAASTTPARGTSTTAPATTATWKPSTNSAQAAKAQKAFAQSEYSEADAAAAQKAFKLPTLKVAKEFIGDQILKGKESVLTAKGITREEWDTHELNAAFSKSRYSDDDVKQAMKKFPFLTTEAKAKEYIGLKIVNGSESILSAKGISPEAYDRHECIAAFERSQYSSADLKTAMKKLDFLRNGTVEDAKDYIGLKIINGTESILREVGVTPSRYDSQDQLAAFDKAGYTAANVRAAKQAFDFLAGSSDQEVKEYIGLKVLNGYEEMLREVNIAPPKLNPAKPADTLSAFNRSRYTDDDAKAALKKLPFLTSLSDAKKYIGLKVLQNTERILSEVGITPEAYDAHECLAAFEKSGYTADDVKAAKKAFTFLKNLSDKEVKEYIGLKIINDYEQMLSEVGITRGRDQRDSG
ncbi:MAG: hypothetical protein JNG84_13085 [Archangium sp.]|nr:hypothetical protein [Archangium sp.]